MMCKGTVHHIAEKTAVIALTSQTRTPGSSTRRFCQIAIRSLWNLLFCFFCCPSRLGLRNRPVLLAYLEAGKAADGDVLAQLADLGGNQLTDAHSLLFDKGLIEQAHFLVELRHLAFDDLLNHWSRLASCSGL